MAASTSLPKIWAHITFDKYRLNAECTRCGVTDAYKENEQLFHWDSRLIAFCKLHEKCKEKK